MLRLHLGGGGVWGPGPQRIKGNEELFSDRKEHAKDEFKNNFVGGGETQYLRGKNG